MTNQASPSPDGAHQDLLAHEVPESLSGLPLSRLGLKPQVLMRLIRLGAMTIPNLATLGADRYLKATGAKVEDIQAIRQAVASLAGVDMPDSVPPRADMPVSPPVLPEGLLDRVYDLSVDGIGLPPRIRDGLVGYGISTLRDLRDLTEAAFLKACPQLGMAAVEALRQAVVQLYRLEPDAPASLAPASPVPSRPASSDGQRNIAPACPPSLAARPISELGLNPRILRIALATGAPDIGGLAALPESAFIDAGGDRHVLLSLRHAIHRATSRSASMPAPEVLPEAAPVPAIRAAALPPQADPVKPVSDEVPLLSLEGYSDAVLDTSLDALELTARAHAALTLFRCVTVRDAGTVTRRQFLSCRGVGTRSIGKLLAGVEALSARREQARRVPAAAPIAYELDTPVRPHVEESILALPESASRTLAKAFGLCGADLENPLSVTACTGETERAALAACADGSAWQGPLRRRLAALAYEAPIPLSALTSRAWARGLSDVAVARLVSLAGWPDVWVFPSRGADAFGWGSPIVAPLPRRDWESALDRAWGVVEEADAGATAGDVAGLAWDALGTLPVHVRSAVVEAVVSGGTPGAGVRSLVSPGEMRDTVRAVLAGSPVPMPVDAIREGVSEGVGATVPLGRVMGTLGEVAYWSHADCYGSLAAIESAGGPARIAHAVLGIMGHSPRTRWTVEQMSTCLLPRIRIAPHALHHALKDDVRFAWYGRTSFGPARPQVVGPRSLQDAAAALLSEAGRPMSERDLRKSLAAIRGEDRPPVEDGRLFRLDAKRWGLVERDVPIPDATVRAVVAAVGGIDLARPLNLRQVLALIKRTVPGIEALTPEWLGAVLRASGDYEIGQRKTVRRSNLAPLAPGLVGERVHGVLARASDPMTARQVALAVGDATGRFPDERTVRVALKAKGVPSGSGSEATWTLRDGASPAAR